MDKLKVLVLGDGLLGSEIIKQTNWDFVSRKKTGFNINDISESIPKNQYNVIINCIGFTDTYSKDKNSHWCINFKFVSDLVDYCNINNIKLVHIATDYLYTNSVINATENDIPMHCHNWYGYTKLLGDGIVQLKSKDYLLCRCTHKPNPFPYEKGWVDQVGNFDYVNIISTIIIKMIRKNLNGLYNVGTETKSMYDLGLITKNNIKPVLAPDYVPKNTTMCCDKLNNDLKNE